VEIAPIFMGLCVIIGLVFAYGGWLRTKDMID
jgi:hypothetical protein